MARLPLGQGYACTLIQELRILVKMVAITGKGLVERTEGERQLRSPSSRGSSSSEP